IAAGAGGGAAPAGGGAGGGTKAGGEKDIPASAFPTPVMLEVDASLTSIVDVEKGEGKAFMEMIGLLRRQLYDDLGVRFPGVRVRGEQKLGEGGWMVRIFDVPLFRGHIPIGYGFTAEP